MSQVGVSIIIVNYNTPDLVYQCVQSIYEHTKEISFEVIVVDNASTVGSLSPVAADFPEVHLVYATTNLGFSGGNNMGIRLANGAKILLLNSDTVLLNNAVLLANKYLDAHPNVGVVSGQLVYPDGRVQSCAQRFPNLRWKLLELSRLQKLLNRQWQGRLLLGAFFDHRQSVCVDWVWGTFFLFRREVLQKLPGGKLNDEYFMYWEDVQWCWDIKKAGYAIAFTPEPKIMHLMGASSGAKQAYMHENYQFFLAKNYMRLHAWAIRCADRLLQL